MSEAKGVAVTQRFCKDEPDEVDYFPTSEVYFWDAARDDDAPIPIDTHGVWMTHGQLAARDAEIWEAARAMMFYDFHGVDMECHVYDNFEAYQASKQQGEK